ncbi:C69 family dipeptidase [Prevotella sp. A2931]|uniref:Dipeptidase n=1 Tax=Prevotella illustrans TaxID=2800387 RepID=A0ABS3M379_9BACT|nr:MULTISPECIES: C69 family dipeptidase [Prevotella]MBO1362642.1 C69 family dipeptidase [Prevotella illustrans]PTL25184.1 peptidase C69 [Prevotella sp. oral taxon 820]
MKKIYLLMLSLLFVASYSLACTNFIVGKGASVNGSVICTYNADDYGMFIGLAHYPAGIHKKGEMRQVYDWDTKVYHGQIPEAPVTYNVIGNINEYQVTIGETTYGGREEMVDSTGILDYGSLIYIALQRSKTARQAIYVMTTLAETYGYNSEGETFTICDPNEAWIMEMMGKGPGSKGVVWVAQRIPDNAICAHANQSRIGKFNMKDKQNVLYSKDVIKFARQKGWFSGKDADFSWKMVYAAPDFSGRRFCDARVWAFFNHFKSGFDRYLPWAEGKDLHAEDMPLWVVPDHKLSIQDVQMAMRDHYEGTPLATDTLDFGGGIWQMPYRPTPLTFKVDGKSYFNERPTSTQQTGFSYVSEMRSWLPREIGGVLWFGNDDGNMVAYTPVYCGNTVQPECYNTPDVDAVTFSMKNAYWVCNWVSNMVYPRYSLLFPELKAVRDSLEHRYFVQQEEVEAHAKALYTTDKAAALKYLNDYSNLQAQRMLNRWNELAVYLIVKYNDMAVKPTKDGRFLRTDTGLGAKVKRPGYPTSFAKKLVQATGTKFAVPEKK